MFHVIKTRRIRHPSSEAAVIESDTVAEAGVEPLLQEKVEHRAAGDEVIVPINRHPCYQDPLLSAILIATIETQFHPPNMLSHAQVSAIQVIEGPDYRGI